MAEDSVESFLQQLPHLIQQAERHVHNDNLNIIEYLRRRLNDSSTALRIIVMHCIEQDICNEVVIMLREVFERVSASLEHYNELCEHSHGDQELQANCLNFRFYEEDSHRPGRPRVDVPRDVLVNFYSVHNSWNIISRILFRSAILINYNTTKQYTC